MKRSELTEFSVEEEGFKLKIRRGSNGLPLVSTSRGSNPPFPAAETPPTPTPAPSIVLNPAKGAEGDGSAPDETGATYIKSPMVGTFYRATSPENPPLVDVGAKIVDTSVVCIIEAMKIMNEIQAESKGTIMEVLVENGQPVEYGQRLFKVRAG